MLINKKRLRVYCLEAGPEFMISDTFIGEARVGGKLDRIDFFARKQVTNSGTTKNRAWAV
jgi:hypothetical protein